MGLEFGTAERNGLNPLIGGGLVATACFSIERRAFRRRLSLESEINAREFLYSQ